jgi:phage shock protein C
MQAGRLHRSSREKLVFGVAGGLAQFWDVDPVLVRIGFVVLALASAGVGILLYLALAIIMPQSGTQTEGEPAAGDEERAARRRNALGISLIAVGGVLLLGNIGFWFQWQYVWPVVLIALGAAIIIGRMRTS